MARMGFFALAAVTLAGALAASSAWAGAVKYAGVRAEMTGVSPQGWHNAVQTFANLWPGAQKMIFMTVGTVTKGGAKLDFPASGATKPNITHATSDALESHLAYFDQAGIKATLIIRPGLADVGDLIDLTLARYKQHASFAGITVSVMYLGQADPARYFEGRKVTDAEAEAWEKKLLAARADLKLVLMHWDPEIMPPAYRGGIIFATESSENTVANLVNEYKTVWQPHFAPNMSFFCIGSEEDRTNYGKWSTLKNPTKEFGEAVEKGIDADMGIFWIDVKGILPTTPVSIGSRLDRQVVPSARAAGFAPLFPWKAGDKAELSIFSADGRFRLNYPAK